MKKIKSSKPEKELPARLKIYHWFFAYPTEEFTLNDLCSAVEIAKTTGKVIVQELVKQGFLEVKPIGRLWRIRAQKDHRFFSTIKIAYNLELVYQSNVIEEVMKQYPQAKSIILFGSYRKGDDVAESDLDVAVEVLDNTPMEIVEMGIIGNLGYRENVKVNVHVFSRNNVDLNVFTNIANGIVLDGLLEVRP